MEQKVSASVLSGTLKLTPKVAQTPPGTGKRRLVVLQLTGNTSTPMSGGKKLFLESDRTTGAPSVANSLNRSTCSSSLNHTLTSSTRTLRITRGVQTNAPAATANRYCQVTVTRIPKPTTTASVQTDDVGVCSVPVTPVPEKVMCRDDVGCQTEEPVVQVACIGTSQLGDSHVQVHREDVECQTEWAEPALTGGGNIGGSVDTPTRFDSFGTMLNNVAREFGVELSPEEKRRESKKKKKKLTKEKENGKCHKESLVNELCTAVASKVDEKVDTILERHLAVYGRKIATSRQQFTRWMQKYLHRQKLKEELARSTAAPKQRKVIVVRPRTAPVAVRPVLEEKSIQCDVPRQSKGCTVGTQWQRQTVIRAKRKPVQKVAAGTNINPNISTGSKPAAGPEKPAIPRKGPMRQTKLSSYTEGKAGPSEGKQQQTKQQQQGKCAPKLPAKPAVLTPTRQRSSPAAAKTKKGAKSKNSKQVKEPTPKVHIEETPSEPSDTEPTEKKHYPYRTPNPYPSQCSKSTETSFLTPTKVRAVPEPPNARQSQQHHQSVLVSPMERMYVRRLPPTIEPVNYNGFLVPQRTGPSPVTPSTPPNMVYVNRQDRRLLVRSTRECLAGMGLVREKPPEVSIISSQQLYSQIGLAVEKALKAQKIPSLDTMYGEPFVEVFNGDFAGKPDNGKDDKGVADRKRIDQFVCSSAKDKQHQQQGQLQCGERPVFQNDRSPSLSPIVYQDDDSGEELL